MTEFSYRDGFDVADFLARAGRVGLFERIGCERGLTGFVAERRVGAGS